MGFAPIPSIVGGAALVNPVWGENQPDSTGPPEMVYVLRRTTAGPSLKGWSILAQYNIVA